MLGSARCASSAFSGLPGYFFEVPQQALAHVRACGHRRKNINDDAHDLAADGPFLRSVRHAHLLSGREPFPLVVPRRILLLRIRVWQRRRGNQWGPALDWAGPHVEIPRLLIQVRPGFAG